MSRYCLMTAGRAAEMMGGRLIAGNGEACIESVSIDSRKTVPGSIFFALKGEYADGHDFIAGAVSAGAVCCVAERETGEIKKLKLETDCAFIIVGSTMGALQQLAGKYRQGFPGIYITGITGSSGKTTTKELLSSILSLEGPTVMNEGNLNSETGLPLSVFRIRPEHRFGVFELGMNHAGEMDILVDILRPDYAVVTNIGTAHIGLLGSRDNIAKEKFKIFHDGECFRGGAVFEKDDYSEMIAEKFGGKISFFGPESQAGYLQAEDNGLEGSIIRIGEEVARFPLPGRHNLMNAFAAVKAAKNLGISDRKIREGLESAKPLFGRGEIVKGSVTVIFDCYNSNRESVRAALEFLDSVKWSGRKAVLLGSILELGNETERIHDEVVRNAFSSSADGVFFFGKEFENFHKVSGHGSRHVFWSDDPGKMSDRLSAYLKSGDLILFKGSRGMALERFLEITEKINRVVTNC